MARLGVLKGAVQIEAASDDAGSAGVVAEAMATESSEGAVLSFPDGRSVACLHRS